MENIYRFYWGCGRMGDVEGVFIAKEEDIKNAIDKYVYFGEILGKHSEVYGNLEDKDLTIMSSDPNAIKVLREIFKYGTISGYNPLDYIMCEKCDDTREYCTCNKE